ncbi:lipoprotein YvcA, partial [Priestia flexa]|nr:lipoprotein YvcA [Priestia flexa]
MSDEQSIETKSLDQKPSEVATEEFPNTRALQDEFTRDMIKSTKETEKGYYTLESKTGVYEMLFP